MTMRRRDVFGLGALGAGAVALEGCGGGFVSGGGASMSADDVDRLLARVDRVVERLGMLDADPKRFGIEGSGKEVDAGRERCLGLLTTLCFLGTYRELRDEVRHDPRVEAHVEKTMPRIQATLAGARAHLGAMSDEDLASIERRLLDEPDLAMRIMEQVDDYAKTIDVPFAQRTYLRVSTAELAARFRYDGATRAVTKLSRTFDRIVSARTGAPELAPPACDAAERSNVLASPTFSRGVAGESCTTDSDCGELLTCRWGVCTGNDTPSSARIMDAAKQSAKWGLWLLIPPACSIGVLILLTSLFMVIVAGLVAAGGD
jgi:hypothetical protein